MSFANPSGLWLLAALPLVLIFHLFAVRRQTVRVTTLHLFEPREPAGGEPQPAWRHFRPSWLLALQLLAVLAIALAVARPALHSNAAGYPREVLVIDVSASMRATDVPGGRFAAARMRALEAVDALQPGQTAMLMTTRPALIVPFTAEHGRLRSALEALGPSDASDNMDETLRIANELSRDSPAARIRVFSDGAREQRKADAQEPPSLPVHWRIAGERSNNAGITEFELRRSSAGAYQVFVAVGNYATQARQLRFQLALDDAPLYEQTLDLGPGVRRDIVLPLEHRRAGVLTASIIGDDDLAADDTVHAVLPPPVRRRVELVSAGNLFLEEALRAEPSNAVKRTQPGSFDASAAPADVTVIDAAFDGKLPPGRYLLIRALPRNAPLERTGEVAVPPVVDWSREHPITRYLDLDGTIVHEAMTVRPTGGGTTLAESPETPLIHAWDADGVRAVFIGFDLNRSDLRVRTAFPMLVANALDWLAPVRLDEQALYRSAEDGESAGLRASNGVTTAINLLSERESNLAPDAALRAQAAAVQDDSPGFERAHPLWRWLAALAIAALLAEAWLYMRRRAHVTAALLPRLLVLALVGAAMFSPPFGASSDTLHVVFALDGSASIAPAERAQASRQVLAAAVPKRDADTASVLSFSGQASDVSPDALGGDDSAGTPAADDARAATDIAGAIRHALVRLPPRGDRRIVVLSDGNENRGAVLDAAREAHGMGVAVHAVPVGGAAPGEVWLDGIDLPVRTGQGEPFTVRLTAWSQRATDARLELTRSGETIAAETVSLRDGKNVLVFDQVIDEQGYATFEARITADGDANEQNNWSIGVVAVSGRPRVLVLDAEPARTKHLTDVLSAQAMDVTVRGPDAASDALTALGDYDALVLSDISALYLSGKDMQRVHDYVHDQGGGLLMLGGEQSFGLGGYYQTPVEQALPVTMKVRQKLDVPSTAIVLVIDRSGSMNRFDGEFNRLSLAKEAAQRAVELLSERSEIGVLAFDMKSHWVVPIAPNGDKGAVMRSIATMRAGGGGTQLLWGLQKAYRAIAKRETVIRHVIILSDGEVYSSKFPELLGNMVGKNITVSAVTIGSKTGRPQLRLISELGKGRFYYSSDASKLPRIFTMETQIASKSALVEEPFTPAVTDRFHEILDSVDWTKTPPLRGYVATTPKRTAQTLLTSHHDDPLLSVWRYGLGRAAVFTSELKPRWGAQWLRWNELGTLAAQIVRWTARSRRSGDLDVQARVNAHTGELSVDAVNEEGKLVNFLDGEARIVSPDQQRSAARVRQSGPGRYEARFAAASPGAYLVGVSLRGTAGPVATATTRVVQPYPREHRELTVNTPLLSNMARIGGGQVLNKAQDVYALPRVAARHAVDAWPWLLAIALAALFIDLGCRYWLHMRRLQSQRTHAT